MGFTNILLKNPGKVQGLIKQISWKIRKRVLKGPGFSVKFSVATLTWQEDTLESEVVGHGF